MPENSQKYKKITPLRTRKNFLHAQQQGRKWISKGLIIEVVPNEESQMRVGFTVSKRVSKLAVKRNLLKRRLRSAAAEALASYAHLPLDIVLIGRASSFERDFEDLKKDLLWCLKKLEVQLDAKP